MHIFKPTRTKESCLIKLGSSDVHYRNVAKKVCIPHNYCTYGTETKWDTYSYSPLSKESVSYLVISLGAYFSLFTKVFYLCEISFVAHIFLLNICDLI